MKLRDPLVVVSISPSLLDALVVSPSPSFDGVEDGSIVKVVISASVVVASVGGAVVGGAIITPGQVSS